MCNALVCLAVWMCSAPARPWTKSSPPRRPWPRSPLPLRTLHRQRLLHSAGIIHQGRRPDSFWASIGKTVADFPALTWGNFLANLVPVTIGNIIGGSLMVGAVYWFIYLRKKLI